jgi:3-methyladenine DNA glycosylase AlkC
MPEPFKNLFNKTIISGMGRHFSKACPNFDQVGFKKAAMKNLKALELKERSAQITNAMVTYLPSEFEKTAEIILASLSPEDEADINNADELSQGIEGWAVMPMVDYVGLYGHEHFDLSMTLFKEMTKRSSSEFGIRFFLLKDPERTLSVLREWTNDPNTHVRRLASEGTRPRLPWGKRLPAFIKNPAPLLTLLENLKDDKEEYVRRSVANNLNDIAKDHPDLVAKIAKNWLKGASTNRKRLVRHACRTLIKQGHQKTLKAFGYGPPSIHIDSLKLLTPKIIFGDNLTFELCLTSTSKLPQSLIIDYAIHHKKANGNTTPKVFKWKVLKLTPLESLKAKKNHSIRKITTRAYYPGTHRLEILINGISFGIKNFELTM